MKYVHCQENNLQQKIVGFIFHFILQFYIRRKNMHDKVWLLNSLKFAATVLLYRQIGNYTPISLVELL